MSVIVKLGLGFQERNSLYRDGARGSAVADTWTTLGASYFWVRRLGPLGTVTFRYTSRFLTSSAWA